MVVITCTCRPLSIRHLLLKIHPLFFSTFSTQHRMACTNTVFFSEVPDPLPTLNNNPAGTLLQSSPTLFVALVWIWIESRTARRGSSLRLQRQSRLVGCVATVAQCFSTWRVFDLLHCKDGEWANYVKPWQYVAVVGVALANGLLLLVLGPRFARTSIVMALSVACGSVVADWSLRGGVVTSSAAHPLVAFQQAACVLVVCLLYNLPVRRHRVYNASWAVRAPTDRPHTATIDALASKTAVTRDCEPASDRSWSWFW